MHGVLVLFAATFVFISDGSADDVAVLPVLSMLIANVSLMPD